MDPWTSCHVWGTVLVTNLEKCWSETLAWGDLGHPCRNVTEHSDTNWVLAVGEHHKPLQRGGGISNWCQACCTIWGQAFGRKTETMEIFSSAESWNSLRRLRAPSQLSRLRSPFQTHGWSQVVSNHYSKMELSSLLLVNVFLGSSFFMRRCWFL